jgi:D-alanyl-D-alanine carboxypeptidase/D-alanyl-D-alanine-endopeptidase (penicillin-binding protein 4)
VTAAAAAAAALPAPPALAGESHGRLAGALDAAMRRASPASGAYVYDLTDRVKLFSRRATTARILASNTKLFTTAAALSRFGAGHRFVTEVLADRLPDRRGVVRGRLYLRGGGDPAFGSASFARRAYGGRGGATLAELARQLRRAGVRRVTGGVEGDESLFDSLRGGPGSGYGISAWVGPLSALAYNRGLARENGSAFQREPPLFAAKRLKRALERRGVRVDGRAAAGIAPPAAKLMAAAESLSLARIVRITNTISDNFFAEMLAKHLAARPGRPGTTAGGAAAATGLGSRLGASLRLVDGSGLARGNVGTPRGIVRFLTRLGGRRMFAPLYASLAVPRRHGTLAERRTSRRCRGKTGTLVGVSNLSGYCRTARGDVIAFSILMSGVGYDYDRAQRLQDRMSRAIARYG